MSLSKLDVALRRHKGKEFWSEYMADIAKALGRPEESISLVSIEETHRLREMFNEKIEAYYTDVTGFVRRTWHSSEIQDLLRLLSRMRDEASLTPMIVLRDLSDYCGAVITTSKEVLDRAMHLVTLDQDDLMTLNKDASSGLLFSFGTDVLEFSEEGYELIAWGQEWEDLIAEGHSPR